ncbi:hypothetical protein NL676_036570 [Syzygium grande]|nr:hypothetical protein NL676_036570 [Syzygium grande]
MNRALGVVWTTPLVASLGASLTVPFAMLEDILIHGRRFSLIYILGSVQVFLGFVLVNLSEEPKTGHNRFPVRASADNNRTLPPTTMVSPQPSKLAPVITLIPLFVLCFSGIPAARALNVGVQATDAGVSVGKECSRKCESEFCSFLSIKIIIIEHDTVPPFLRYDKYCGLLYSGCPGEKPCDGLDACCMKRDACVQAKNNDYLSQECSQNLLNCMANFKNLQGRTFKGSECQVEDVVDILSVIMDAALLAGRYLHKP